ncbi:outer membrane lipoprotein-sorting protein [Vibrio anguillarum]|uniref:outer membrane lipoprotein-sorting protein n=1 Tax=Vibrio anguillarum TaxID=55601 RepID=UPI00188C8C7C|nr:outer membrane lipoprotein-sorting protein [Vibrio anguillarum]MBF4336966.1 outer membrane lipoprotein-sorting protein [Vibrio anguillarum]
MYKWMMLLLITLSGGYSAAGWAALDAGQMTKNADQYRLGYSAAKVVSLVSLYERGELDKTRQYHVYTKANRDSLVVFKSSVEAGQKMLMLDENYWLLMPKSRRPIRITPMQKLLGEASVGDISTLTWSEDYQSQLMGEEQIETPNGQPYLTHKLSLLAVTEGANYQQIILWLEKENDFPIKASLYLRSGKLAKQAWFRAGEKEGRMRVTSMTLLDQIQPTKKTVVEYQHIEPMELDEKYYNPAYLTRNSLSEL